MQPGLLLLLLLLLLGGGCCSRGEYAVRQTLRQQLPIDSATPITSSLYALQGKGLKTRPGSPTGVAESGGNSGMSSGDHSENRTDPVDPDKGTVFEAQRCSRAESHCSLVGGADSSRARAREARWFGRRGGARDQGTQLVVCGQWELK
jgi:hypothetical protein